MSMQNNSQFVTALWLNRTTWRCQWCDEDRYFHITSLGRTGEVDVWRLESSMSRTFSLVLLAYFYLLPWQRRSMIYRLIRRFRILQLIGWLPDWLTISADKCFRLVDRVTVSFRRCCEQPFMTSGCNVADSISAAYCSMRETNHLLFLSMNWQTDGRMCMACLCRHIVSPFNRSIDRGYSLLNLWLTIIQFSPPPPLSSQSARRKVIVVMPTTPKGQRALR